MLYSNNVPDGLEPEEPNEEQDDFNPNEYEPTEADDRLAEEVMKQLVEENRRKGLI